MSLFSLTKVWLTLKRHSFILLWSQYLIYFCILFYLLNKKKRSWFTEIGVYIVNSPPGNLSTLPNKLLQEIKREVCSWNFLFWRQITKSIYHKYKIRKGLLILRTAETMHPIVLLPCDVFSRQMLSHISAVHLDGGSCWANAPSLGLAHACHCIPPAVLPHLYNVPWVDMCKPKYLERPVQIYILPHEWHISKCPNKHMKRWNKQGFGFSSSKIYAETS